jgi:hypothetical protein
MLFFLISLSSSAIVFFKSRSIAAGCSCTARAGPQHQKVAMCIRHGVLLTRYRIRSGAVNVTISELTRGVLSGSRLPATAVASLVLKELSWS